VLSYPCKPEDANLGVISYLKKVYPGIVVGYSDHVPPSHECSALVTAWLMGARIIEKHFTLDKSRAGNDHYHAMDPDDIRRFREHCRYVTSLIGRGEKVTLECEKEARKQARRSLVAARAIKAGEQLKPGDIAIKRPGTGIRPEMLEVVAGRTVHRDVQEDEILGWDVFLT
jgi:N-acetylneuraminate synthase